MCDVSVILEFETFSDTSMKKYHTNSQQSRNSGELKLYKTFNSQTNDSFDGSYKAELCSKFRHLLLPACLILPMTNSCKNISNL